jgi:hypothetical protein
MPVTQQGTLDARKRAIRLVATVTGLVLLVLGTVWGNDDEFPFGPFSMYSTSNKASGLVTVLTLEGRTASGSWTRIAPSSTTVGMNVAEFEGQQPRFEADPSLLGAVARSYERLNPDEDSWVAMRLIRRATVIEDKVPTGEVTEEILAEWEAS